MSDISNQLIKNSYDYVLQSDLSTGVVYRIGGNIPVNPIFSSGLTINSSFNYTDGSESLGYVLTSDGSGNATWKPVSAATPSSGVTSINVSTGLSADSTTGVVTIINTSPDKTVIITGGTNIQIVGTYPNFGINFTGQTSFDYLPLSGGTITGGTIFQSGLTANTISATTYYNLPLDVYTTGGTYSNGTILFTNNSGGTYTVVGLPTSTGTTTNYYGSFSDTTTQVVSGSNIPTVWTYNTTELSNGIYIQDGSKITVSNSGIYEIAYSAQIEKTQGGTSSDVTIWTTINGNIVDRSSSTITFNSNTSYQLPFVSYFFELNAGDYVEFYFSSPSEHIQLTTLSGLTSPTRPISPSVIIVAKAIGNAVLNTSGDTFTTGFTLSGSDLILSQNRVGQYSGFTVNLPFLPLSGGTVTGPISATTYYGDGSNLSGISRGGGGGAGGELYYFNISKTQSPYYELATSATTSSEQTISASTNANSTSLVGGFMTPSSLNGITSIPAGILTFYLHCYDGGTNHNFNVYCELYKRTSGGTETLLFTSDPTPVIGNIPYMVISDGFFTGATINSTDRIVVKVYGQNLTNQTRTFYFVSEGSQHYSFVLTTIPTDIYVTGFTYSNNTLTIKQNRGQSDLSQTITGFTGLTINGDLTVTGSVSATTYYNIPNYLSGGTSDYIPLWTGTSSLTISYLNQSNNTLKTIFNSNEKGLKIDFTESVGILGTSTTGDGYVKGVGSVFGQYPTVILGDSDPDDLNPGNGTIFRVDDNGQYIKTYNGGYEKGLNLNFASRVYSLGETTSNNITNISVDDTTKTITSNGNLKLSNYIVETIQYLQNQGAIETINLVDGGGFYLLFTNPYEEGITDCSYLDGSSITKVEGKRLTIKNISGYDCLSITGLGELEELQSNLSADLICINDTWSTFDSVLIWIVVGKY